MKLTKRKLKQVVIRVFLRHKENILKHPRIGFKRGLILHMLYVDELFGVKEVKK